MLSWVETELMPARFYRTFIPMFAMTCWGRPSSIPRLPLPAKSWTQCLRSDEIRSAVTGVEEVLRSLSIGQVRTLLVDPKVAQAGFRCNDSGRLTIVEGTCSDEGGAESVPDIIDEAIEEALRQGCHVDVVQDETARLGLDGLAALLRFTGG